MVLQRQHSTVVNIEFYINEKNRGLQSSDPIQSNPQSFLKILTQSNPIQPNPIQSNPWMDPIHVQLWVFEQRTEAEDDVYCVFSRRRPADVGVQARRSHHFVQWGSFGSIVMLDAWLGVASERISHGWVNGSSSERVSMRQEFGFQLQSSQQLEFSQQLIRNY